LPADAAIDKVGHPTDVRACRWAGFAPQVTYEGAGHFLAVADFNGDGHIDVVATAWGGIYNGTASVYLNQGNGTFVPPTTYNTDMEAEGVAAADFSGDGKPDFAVGNDVHDLDVFLNQGDGTFGPFVQHRVPGYSGVMVASDFNRDGHPDLAATQSSSIAIFLGDGQGSFSPPTTYASGGNVDSITVSDLNGDGYPDIVVSNADFTGLCPEALCLPTGLGAGTANVFINQGDGTFAPQASYAAGNGTGSVAVGDFNSDGAPDIAAVNGVDNTLSVFFNQGDGTFAPQVTYSNTIDGFVPVTPFLDPGGEVVAADFDGDGRDDVVVVQCSSQGRNGMLIFRAGNGDGTFRVPVTYPIVDYPGVPVVADFNGDGFPDVAVTISYDKMGVFLSDCE
jgi:hypothetical protein